MNTRTLAAASLTLRAEIEREHARRALSRLGATDPADRCRRGGRCDSAASREWRRARRALRHAAELEEQRRALG